MRLTAFHIDGFGIYHDQGLREIAPGLTLFLGANEAGKSTLLGFLRAMPFGFEGNRPGDGPRYEPLNGGDHGGWIEFVTDTGNIHRLMRSPSRQVAGEVRLTDAHGGSADESVLRAVLGGTDKAAYASVYAFSIAQLQFDHKEGEEGLALLMSAAAMGMGDVSVVGVQDALGRRADGLYRQQGRNPAVNKTLAALRELRAQLAEARAARGEYDVQRSRLDELEAQTQRHRAEHGELTARIRRLESLQRAWPMWVELQGNREELAGLAVVESFPADGVARLEGLLGKHEEQQGAVAELTDKIALKEKQRGELAQHPALVEQQSEIEAMVREQQHLRELLEHRKNRQSELDAAEAQLGRDLQDLGPKWTEERLRTFDISSPVVNAARDLGQRIARTETESADARRELARANERVDAAERALKTEEAGLADDAESETLDADGLRERRSRLPVARQAFVGRAAAQADAEHMGERRADLERQREATQARVTGGRVVPAWVGVVVGLIVAAVIGIATRTTMGVALGVGVGVVFAAFLAWGIGRLTSDAEERRGQAVREIESLDAALAERHEEMAEAETRATQAEARIAEIAAQLDAELASEADVEAASQAIDEALAALQRQESVREVVERARRTRDEALDAVKRAQESVQAAGEAEGAAREAWREWLADRGLGETPPEGFTDLVARIRELRERLVSIDDLRGRVVGMADDIQSIATRAHELWASCGRDAPDTDSLPAAIGSLAAELTEAREALGKAEAIGVELEGLRASMGRADGQLESTREETAALLVTAQADDEEEFRRKGELQARRRELEAAVRDGEQKLAVIVGPDAQEAFEAELQETSPEGIGEELEALRERGREVNSQRTDADREFGELNQQIRELETSDEIARLLQEEESLVSTLRGQIEEYGTVSAALFAIGHAREKYERERQPEVVEEASRRLRTITGGRYPKVFIPFGESQQLCVEDRDGQRKEVAQLSRGTQQQLYLAMRLAYVKVHHRSGAESLPLVMDEVLTLNSFDPERQKRTAELILDVAQEDQVFVFTCHPQTVEMFQGIRPDVPVVALEDGSIAARTVTP